jgi:hypothetical protein
VSADVDESDAADAVHTRLREVQSLFSDFAAYFVEHYTT